MTNLLSSFMESVYDAAANAATPYQAAEAQASIPGYMAEGIDDAIRADLEAQGFVWNSITKSFMPPAGYTGSQADFAAGVQKARERIYPSPVPLNFNAQQPAVDAQSQMEQMEVQAQQPFTAIPDVRGSGWATSTSDPTSLTGGTNSTIWDQAVEAARPLPEPGLIPRVIEGVGDIPLRLPAGGDPRVGRTSGTTVGDVAGAVARQVAPVIGPAIDAYNTDIPYYSDFARDTLQPAVSRAANVALPGAAVIGDALPIVPSPGQVASAMVPVTAGDVALELIPGVGFVPDAARVGRQLASEGAEAVARRTGQGLGSELGAIRVPGGGTPGMEPIATRKWTSMADGTPKENTYFLQKVRDLPQEQKDWFYRHSADRLFKAGGEDAYVVRRSANGVVDETYFSDPMDRSDALAQAAEEVKGSSHMQDLHVEFHGRSGQAAQSRQAAAEADGAAKRESEAKFEESMRRTAQEESQRYNALVQDLGKGGRKAETTVAFESGPAVREAWDVGVPGLKVFNASSDPNPKYAQWRINHDATGLMVADGFKSRAEATAAARAIGNIADWTAQAPNAGNTKAFLDAFRKGALPEEFDALRAAPAPAPSTSKMTPDAVSAVRRRTKGGDEIPFTQDPMATTATAGRRGRQAAAGGTPPPPIEPPSSVATAEPPPPPRPPTGTGSGGEEFAGNIRLSKYPEDIRDTIKGWADANPDVVQNARRGTIPDEQVETMARELVNDLGGDFNKVKNGWKAGQAWSAEEIVAIRGSLNDATQKVVQAAETARAADTTANQLALTEAILEQQRIQQIVHGVTAEAGRALRAFRRQAVEAMAGNDVARMQELMRHALKVSDTRDVTNLTEMIRALDLDDPAAVNAFMRNINKPGFTDYMYEFWINSVLSGPVTHLRNIFGNTAATLYSPVERIGAAAVEGPVARLQGRQAERFWQEAPASVIGMVHGFPDGVRGAIDVMRHGFNPNDLGRLEIRRQAFTGKAGRVIRFPTNALEAMDSFFHAINYRSALYGDAVRQARKEGLSDVALRNRIAELINEPTTGMVKSASDEAERLLFRNDPGAAVGALMNFRDKVPGLKYVLPFVRTPANLMRYGVKHSPLGLLDAPMWKRLVAGKPEASDEVARTVMGSMIGTSIGAMIATGKIEITGAVPSDAAERDRFYREGKLPFSVKIPGIGHVQYNQIPVLDTTLTSVAAVVEGIKNGDDVTSIATETAGIIAQSMLDKSYLNGLADLFDAVSDPARYAERFAVRQITGFVPFSSALRQTAQSIDRTVRDPRGLAENIKAGIPGMTDQVRPRLDAFGNEATRAQPSPLQINPDRQTAVDAELERLGEEVGLIGDSIGGHKLNRDEKAAYQRMAGQFTYLLMDRALAREEYQALDDTQKQKVINDIVGDARDPVRDVLSAVFDDESYAALSAEDKAELMERLWQRWETRIAETVGAPAEPQRLFGGEVQDGTAPLAPAGSQREYTGFNPGANLDTSTFIDRRNEGWVEIHGQRVKILEEFEDGSARVVFEDGTMGQIDPELGVVRRDGAKVLP